MRGCHLLGALGPEGRVVTPSVLLVDVAANFVDDYVNTAFTDCLLILKLLLLAFRAVAIKPLVLHQAFLLFVHLLLDDILG